MGEFGEIFKKVNGKQQLRDYAKSHVLGFALLEACILGLSRKSLEILRLAVQNRIYRRLKKQNRELIVSFVKQNPIQKKNDHRKTIWTIWLQGMEEAPAVVRKCYESMKNNLSNWEIIVITEKNYANYITFPDYIMDKYEKGSISKPHFADLIRIELLAKYGGTWLDGTVYCSEFINGKHDFYLDSDLFVFQNMKPGLDGHCASISSWMITASAEQNIILLTQKLLHNYWKNHNFAVDYFILHYFFQMAIEAYPEEWKKVIPVSNSMPFVLLLRLFDKYDENIWNTVKEMTCFHKLTHKFTEEQKNQQNVNGTYYDVVLKKLIEGER